MLRRTALTLGGGAVGSLLLPRYAQALYSTRAVFFSRGTYLINSGVTNPNYLPSVSSQGSFSLWYNSTQPPVIGSSVVLLQGQTLQGTILFSLEIEASTRASAYNLILYVTNGARLLSNLQWAHFQSSNSLAFDGTWRNIAGTWDTETVDPNTKMFPAIVSYGRLNQTGPPTVLLWGPGTTSNGSTFSTPYLGSRWTMGAELRWDSGSIVSPYGGKISQPWFHFGASDYLSIITSFGSPSTTRVFSGVTESDTFGRFVPSELGWRGTGPFGIPVGGTADIFPLFCRTGGLSTFLRGDGGPALSLGVGSNTLQASPDDPFGGTAS